MDKTQIESLAVDADQRLRAAAFAPLDNKKTKLDTGALLEAMAMLEAARLQKAELARREHAAKIAALTARRDELLATQATQRAEADRLLAALNASHKAWEQANWAARFDGAAQLKLNGDYGSAEYRLQSDFNAAEHEALAASMSAQQLGIQITELERTWPDK